MYILTDVPECLVNNGGCQHGHYCHNTKGSYYCSCRTGFRLKPDRHNCEGNTDSHALHTYSWYIRTHINLN